MQITHTKKSKRRWTIVFETEDEARMFNHFIQCFHHNISTYCRYDESALAFREKFIDIVRETGLPSA